MINKTNFTPYYTTINADIYYKCNNKTYSHEEWVQKMQAEGYQRTESTSGVRWSRTVNPLRAWPHSSPYVSMKAYPANHAHLAKTKGTSTLESRKMVSPQPRTPNNSSLEEPCPNQPSQNKKTGLHQAQMIAPQQRPFVPFQGTGHRLGSVTEPVLDREAIRVRWLKGSHSSFSKAEQMICQTQPLTLLRQKNSLLEKITANDYQAVNRLINKMAQLAPTSSISIHQRYQHLLQQAQQRSQTAQEIAAATLDIHPLAIDISKTEPFRKVTPGKPLVVYINYKEEQERLKKQYLRNRLPGDVRNAL